MSGESIIALPMATKKGLTHAQVDELMRLEEGRQAAGTTRSRVHNTLGKLGFATFVEGVVSDYWEITDAGRTALLPYKTED